MAATDARAVQLAQDATSLFDKGDTASAHRAIHEAVALSPANSAVKAAITHLRHRHPTGSLAELCTTWLEQPTRPEAESILRDALAMAVSVPISDQDAAGAMKALLIYTDRSAVCDSLTHRVLRLPGARAVLAHEISDAPTPLFRRLFARGDETMLALLDVLVDVSAWPSADVRVTAVRDVFQLALSTAMEAGLEQPARAMSLVSRLLVKEAQNLHGLMDADGFRVLLDSLDVREPTLLRQQAAIAIATLIEHSPDSAHTLISQYITPRVETPTATTLIRAFSAATAVFPMATAPAITLFLSDGFLPKFVPLVKGKNSSTLTSTAIELLSAACVDRQCRDRIVVHCRRWLAEKAAAGEKPTVRVLAALVLVKTSYLKPQPGSESEKSLLEIPTPDFFPLFRDTVVSESDPRLFGSAIEGLACLSLEPKAKESIAADKSLLSTLSSHLSGVNRLADLNISDSKIEPSVGSFTGSPVFGILTIASNITTFPALLSEEQKKMKEVQAYANSSKPAKADPLETEAHATSRCEKIIESDLFAAFSQILRSPQPPSVNTLRQMTQIGASLARVTKGRGRLAQQGLIKLMRQIYDSATAGVHKGDPASDQVSAVRFLASLAIARVLISINPTTLFDGSSSSVESIIPPLLYLLEDHEGDSPDPAAPRTLTLYEAMLALTNVASVGEDTCNAITKRVFPRLDDILFSGRVLIQRAATELCCNLTTSFEGIVAFTHPDRPAARTRFDLLVALADAEDFPTRRAAGGGLAILTGYPAGVEALLRREGGINRVVRMCEDEESDVVVRALACLENIISLDESLLRSKAVEMLLEIKDVKEVLRNCPLREQADQILQFLATS